MEEGWLHSLPTCLCLVRTSIRVCYFLIPAHSEDQLRHPASLDIDINIDIGIDRDRHSFISSVALENPNTITNVNEMLYAIYEMLYAMSKRQHSTKCSEFQN